MDYDYIYVWADGSWCHAYDRDVWENREAYAASVRVPANFEDWECASAAAEVAAKM